MTKKSVFVVIIGLIAFYFFIFDQEFDFNQKFSKTVGKNLSGSYRPPIQEIQNSTFTNGSSGEEIKLSNLIKDNTNVVLHFWATWCVPCVEEIASLYRYALNQKNAENPPVFVFIAVNDKWVNITKFLEKSKLDQSKVGYWLLDNSGEAYTKFRVDKVPESFILRSGQVERLSGAQVWK